MSYSLGLDEYPEDRLQGELNIREIARREGKCDYCGRRPTTPSCKEHTRHHDPRIAPSEPCSTCGGTGRFQHGPGEPERCRDCSGKGIEK